MSLATRLARRLAPFVSLALALLACDRAPKTTTSAPRATATPSDMHAAPPSASEAQAPGDHPQEDPGQALRPLHDVGVFSDLDGQVEIQCPSWLMGGPLFPVQYPGDPRIWWAVDGVIVCEATGPRPEQIAQIQSSGLQDHDRDGIPDAVDLLRGAKKAALNGASYKSSYRELAFPGGDVPRTEGVCTDVIVRSLRNTGRDLQELLSQDIAARPGAYPMVKRADPHIDHRRVRTLLPYFEQVFEQLPPRHDDSAAPYLPGDLVFMNTIGDREPEHLGIISDRLGKSGNPLVINNWTDGTVTKAMDLIGRVEVTHRFRTGAPLVLDPSHSGLAGVLGQHKLSLPAEVGQVLLVTVPLWESSGGTLTRFERSSGAEFSQMGEQQAVRLGAAGLGTGRGLHNRPHLSPTEKQEGDKRAPAGIFALGTAFGRSPRAPFKGSGWPYRAVGPHDFWIDAPQSPRYNEWITVKPGRNPEGSAEKLDMYSLGLVVEHNTKTPVPGAGSAIFIHPWKTPDTPTIGCTALPEIKLKEILAWLDPEKKPVLVQVAGRLY